MEVMDTMTARLTLRSSGLFRTGSRAITCAGVSLLLGMAAAIAGAHGASADSQRDGNQVVTVSGYPQNRNGLGVWHDECVDDGSVPEPPDWSFNLRLADDAPRGEHVHGWTPTGTGWERGVNAPILRPTVTSVFQIEVKSTSGRVSGHAIVSYLPPGGGVWVGQSPIEASTGSGWQLLDASRVNFRWSFFRDGSFVMDGGSAQLAAFAESKGGDGGGARLGFTLGCDGSAFSFDNFAVGPAGATKIYDFEGYDTLVRLNPTPKCSTSVRDFPAAVSVTGDLARRGNDTRSPQNRYIGQAGRIQLQAKGAKPGKSLASATANSNGRWSLTFRPTKPTRVFGFYAGSEVDAEDRSKSRPIRVYPRIDLKQSQRKVVVGQKVVVSGKVVPAGKHDLTVLRTPWSKSTGWGAMKPALRTRTNRRGEFRVTLSAQSAGVMSIDILTSNSAKISSAISRDSAIFEAKPRKRKPPSTGGGGGSSSPDPGSTVGETASPEVDEFGGGGYDSDSDAPFTGGRQLVADRKVKGYGGCRWRKVGNPNLREVETRATVPADTASTRSTVALTDAGQESSLPWE